MVVWWYCWGGLKFLFWLWGDLYCWGGEGGGSRNFEVKIKTAEYQYKEYFWNNYVNIL